MSSDIRHGAATDIGLAREANEDSYLAAAPLFVVADGMGGHMAGDVASRLAVEALARLAPQEPSALADAVREANREVHDHAAEQPELMGMGTTITAMLAGPHGADIAHVGDSRAYLLRSGSLTRVTRDHSVVERMVREGRIDPEEADHHPQRSLLERALGVEPDVEVDSYNIATQPGDRIMLCSDGLTTMVDDQQILEILAAEPDPEAASQMLITRALEAGGSDNITVVIVDYLGIPDGGETQTAQALEPMGGVPGETTRPSRRRMLLRAAVLLAVVVGTLGIARAAVLSRWYVAEEDGVVTVFRGVPGIQLPLLTKVEERTDLEATSLPETYRQQLDEGISASGRQNAKEIVANLRDILIEHSGFPSYPSEETP